MVDRQRPVVVQLLDDLSVGGMERSAINLANGLADRGYESHLICSRGAGTLASSLHEDVRLWCAHRTRRWDLGGVRRIARYIDEKELDLIHSHNQTSSYLTRVVFRLCRRRPLHVVTDQNGPGLHSRQQRIIDQMLLRHVDGYVAVTEALRDRARHLLDLPEDRCIYVVNGIEIPPAPEPWTGSPTIVQVANIHWPKGHATAVRAAAIVRRTIPDLKWICVGRIPDPPTEYVREVRTLIASLDLTDCVDLAGECPSVRPYLERAHVGVLTSESEALPLSVLEYMAARLPVVMTDVGQGPAVIRAAQAGRIAPPNDPEAIAQALIDILSDPDQAQTMGESGRAYVSTRFSVEAMTEQVDTLYSRLWSRCRTKHAGRCGNVG